MFTANYFAARYFPTSYFAKVGAIGALLDFVLDLNTRIAVFVRDAFGQPTGDNTTLATRYMTELPSGDANQRFLQMIQDATDAAT